MNSWPVLYVEDDDNDVFFMRRTFAKAKLPYPLHVVSNGLEAIEYLSGEGPYADRDLYPLPRLALLDLKMPRVSGLELLRWIRSRPEFQRLIVVILTSSSHPRDLQAVYAEGANGYVTKFCNAENANPMIKNLLEACAVVHFSASGCLNFKGNKLLVAQLLN